MVEVTYTDVTWTAGDILTEAKLDNMVANDRAVDAMANGVMFTERTNPPTPASTKIHLFAKDSGGTTTLYTIDDAGTVTPVGGTGQATLIMPTTVAGTGSGTTSGTTELDIVSKTITNPSAAGRIFISAIISVNGPTAANDFFAYRLYFAGAAISVVTETVFTTGGGGRSVIHLSAQTSVAATGTQIIKTTVKRDSGTGTISSENTRCHLTWIIAPGASSTA